MHLVSEICLRKYILLYNERNIKTHVFLYCILHLYIDVNLLKVYYKPIHALSFDTPGQSYVLYT